MPQSPHKPEDMRMQGCKQGHTNLRIRRCKDARIQASSQEPEDMCECEDINTSNISNM